MSASKTITSESLAVVFSKYFKKTTSNTSLIEYSQSENSDDSAERGKSQLNIGESIAH